MAASQATANLPATTGERATGERATGERARVEVEKLSIHQLLCRHAERYVESHRDGEATLNVQGALAQLSLCRTSALGGHWYKCDDCSELTKLHNSCGNRHCPQCSGGKRQDFYRSAEKLPLEGVEYYQVVFTLPAEISKMALANRKDIAELLCQSAWKALKKTISKEQGYDPAALMVLHTWNQKLDAHWHVHAVVPGAGPSLHGDNWLAAKAPKIEGRDDSRKYLVDATLLRTSFRKFAVAHLQRLRRAGKLKLGGSLEYLREDDSWEEFIEQLRSVQWVSFIEPPPTESSRPEHVINYLTRYLTGGPISDFRIIAADDKEVTFWAREGEETGGERLQVPYMLPTEEFVRRWCLHIQPGQLTKARYYGGWSNNRRDAYLEYCGRVLEANDVDRLVDTSFNVESFEQSLEGCGEEAELAKLVCEHCGGTNLSLFKCLDKPSWKEIFSRYSQHCPRWYRKTRDFDDRAFWDAAMGAGFSDWYDWYLKQAIEGARGSEVDGASDFGSPPAEQLLFPGLEPTSTVAALLL